MELGLVPYAPPTNTNLESETLQRITESISQERQRLLELTRELEIEHEI